MGNTLIVKSTETARDDNGYIYYQGKLFTGTENWYYDTGELGTSSEYKDGILDGIQTGFYKNGKISGKTHYIKGCVHGLNQDWYENGQLKLEEEIYNGKAVWTKEWDENGNLITDFKR